MMLNSTSKWKSLFLQQVKHLKSQLRDAWSDPVELEEGDWLFAYPKQLPWSI